MTISTSKDHPTDTKPDAAIEPLIACKTQAGLASPHVTSEADLESRINQRRAELIGKLGELTADTRLAAAEARSKLKARLSELAHIIKMGVVDGWTSLGDTVKHNLEHWLAASEPSLPIQDVPLKSRQS